MNTSKWHIKWTSISQSFINASSFDSCLYWMAAQNLCCNLQKLCPNFFLVWKYFSKKAPSYNQTLEQVHGRAKYSYKKSVIFPPPFLQSLKRFGPVELKVWCYCKNAPHAKFFSPNYSFDKETKIIMVWLYYSLIQNSALIRRRISAETALNHIFQKNNLKPRQNLIFSHIFLPKIIRKLAETAPIFP